MTDLQKILTRVIPESYEDFGYAIVPESEFFERVDLYKVSRNHGVANVLEYFDVHVIVPVQELDTSLQRTEIIEVQGKTYSDFRQLESGLVVPKWVGDEANLPHSQYIPKEKMYTFNGVLEFLDSRFF